MIFGLVRRHVAALYLAAWCAGLAFMAPTARAETVSLLFGSRVIANADFPAPFLTGDFDGDGTMDAVYLVTILPGSAENQFAEDVTLLDQPFGGKSLGQHGAKLALAIVQKNGQQKFLLTGYKGNDTDGYFNDAKLWSALPPPVSIAKVGSQIARAFQRQNKDIRYDILVCATEAGIDMALYWDGRSYVLFTPKKAPTKGANDARTG